MKILTARGRPLRSAQLALVGFHGNGSQETDLPDRGGPITMGLGRREVHRAQFVTERYGPQRATESRFATGRRVLGKWNGFGLPLHPFQPACSAGFAGTAGHAGRQPVDDT